MKRLIGTSACYTVLLSAVAVGMAGCSTAPTTVEGQQELTSASLKALGEMKADDTSLQSFLNNTYAYVIFPTVGQGALVVGGAHGHGEAYQGDKLIGYSELDLVNVGAQIGGQQFSELLVFKTKESFDNFTNNPLTMEAAASAVILKSGAAAAAKWTNDIAVFKRSKAGAMVEAAIGGQRFTYKAAPPTP